jgi:hypothetical protein
MNQPTHPLSGNNAATEEARDYRHELVVSIADDVAYVGNSPIRGELILPLIAQIRESTIKGLVTTGCDTGPLVGSTVFARWWTPLHHCKGCSHRQYALR